MKEKFYYEGVGVQESERPSRTLENSRVEADLISAFGSYGDVIRTYRDGCDGDVAEIVGWTVLGCVDIDRGTLPVSGEDDEETGGAEEEYFKHHRDDLVAVIRAAYLAGRESAGRAS